MAKHPYPKKIACPKEKKQRINLSAKTVETFSQPWMNFLNCPPRNHAGVSATGKIRPNIQFAAFWFVFLTKIKVDPESW